MEKERTYTILLYVKIFLISLLISSIFFNTSIILLSSAKCINLPNGKFGDRLVYINEQAALTFNSAAPKSIGENAINGAYELKRKYIQDKYKNSRSTIINDNIFITYEKYHVSIGGKDGANIKSQIAVITERTEADIIKSVNIYLRYTEERKIKMLPMLLVCGEVMEYRDIQNGCLVPNQDGTAQIIASSSNTFMTSYVATSKTIAFAYIRQLFTREMQDDVNRNAKKIVSFLLSGQNINQVTKAELFDQYLAARTAYDIVSAKKKAYKNRQTVNAHCAYGILGSHAYKNKNGNRLAVCQGYAQAFYILCRDAGIQCKCILGKTAESAKNIKNEKKESTPNHMWNEAILDGSKYYIDCTWNDMGPCSSRLYFAKEGTPRAKFFLKKHIETKNNIY